MEKKFQSLKNKFFLGGTSAIITNLALLVGLINSVNAELNIVASILIIAVADNISDTLGIHIYQEAGELTGKDLWLTSLTNFATRFFVSAVFILFVILLPLKVAAVCSLIFGLSLIAVISYKVAKHKKTNPLRAVLSHIIIALLVLLASNFLGGLIVKKFHY